MDNQFLTTKLTQLNQDVFIIRQSILKALNGVLSHLRGRLLDVGCGKMPYKNYILDNSGVQDYVGLDIEEALVYDSIVKPDVTWDGQTMPFDAAVFDCAIATEVLEHCPEPEVVLKEIFRVLKPGGVIFFTVPFLWNLHEVPHDEYRYTPFSLERHLKNSGFDDIDLKATGGWHAAMAQMLGLWVCRSPMSKTKRRFLGTLTRPVMRKLMTLDRPDYVIFKEGEMLTGISGIAIKPL